MAEKVFVTGIGAISAIGNNSVEMLDSLAIGRHGIAFSQTLESVYKNEIPVGAVRLSNKDLADFLGLKSENYFTRTSLLGITAAKEAVENAGIKDLSGTKTGLISGTSVGGMDRSEKFFVEFLKNQSKGRLRDIVGHDCADSTERIADYLGIKGFITTISTACSSSANSIMLGTRLIKSGSLDRVIAGGVDALTIFTLNGFNSLSILDRQHCRPFDESRSGLNLGEGAGFIVLESESEAKRNNSNVLCELKGYGNASDAYHQTASSPEGTGACLAMRKALACAVLEPSAIDYINAHGTGTPNNDLSEGKAIETIFGKDAPYFSSTKAFTGHTLGASGGIEAVISVLSIQNNLLFPNLNFQTRIKDLEISPVKELIRGKVVNNVISNSFGFGGNNSSLVFSAAKIF